MSRKSDQHSADEFGRIGSSALSGLDAPMVGAPTAIIVDGMVERDSGTTPAPPSITVKHVTVALLAMLVLGFLVLGAYGAIFGAKPLPAGWHSGVSLWFDTEEPISADTRFEFSAETNDEMGEPKLWYAHPDAGTTYAIDGEEVTGEEFASAFSQLSPFVSVRVSDDGVVERLSATTMDSGPE